MISFDAIQIMISISISCYNLIPTLCEPTLFDITQYDEDIPAKGSIRARFLFCLLFCTASTLDDSSSSSFAALRLVPAFSIVPISGLNMTPVSLLLYLLPPHPQLMLL